MNIEGLLANGVETVFRILKDLVGLGTYYQAMQDSGSAVYDPITDTSVTPVNTFYDVRMLKVSVVGDELIGSVVTVTDAKILIPASDLPTLTPSGEDHVLLKGVRYNILSPKQIPGDALHILYVREA